MGILFPKQNQEANKAAAEVMRPSVLRWPLMVCLLIIIAGLYWRNFENRLTEILARTSFYDETGIWTPAERQSLAETAKLFRDHWGIGVIVHDRKEVIEVPELGGNSLFIGVTRSGDTTLILPGLVSYSLKVVGERQSRDIRYGLEVELAACLKSGLASSKCLNNTLTELNYLFSTL